MLDLVGGCRAGEAEVLVPAHRRVGEIGMNVGPVKYVSGATGIDHAIGRHGKRRELPDHTGFIVPDQTSLTERDAANPAAPALEIFEHRWRFMAHLLAQAFGDDGYVHEAEKLMGVR